MFRAIKDLKKPLYVITLVMMLSGLIWLYFDYFVEIETEFGASHHPLQKWFLKIHGIGSAVFIFIFGMTYVLHIQKTLKDPERRISGWLNLIFWTLMIVSGYSLLYIAGESVRDYMALFHWILGIFSVLVLFFHSSKYLKKDRHPKPRASAGRTAKK